MQKYHSLPATAVIRAASNSTLSNACKISSWTRIIRHGALVRFDVVRNEGAEHIEEDIIQKGAGIVEFVSCHT
jgi:hypothetical protein